MFLLRIMNFVLARAVPCKARNSTADENIQTVLIVILSCWF